MLSECLAPYATSLAELTVATYKDYVVFVPYYSFFSICVSLPSSTQLTPDGAAAYVEQFIFFFGWQN
jgi:hypothetical protein